MTYVVLSSGSLIFSSIASNLLTSSSMFLNVHILYIFFVFRIFI